MTDCGCDKAKAELEEYLHNELSAEDLRDISEHLASCEDCTADHLVGVTLSKKIRQACREAAPEDLRNAILGRLGQAAAH